MKWSYETLHSAWRALFDQFNPTYPKHINKPGFQEAWNQILAEAEWTDDEWGDALEDHWSGHIP
jgi:hypothetical protein